MNKEFKLDSNWKPFLKLGAICSFLFILYTIATILILLFIGGQPKEIIDIYNLFEINKFTTLLRLDILAVVFIPLYYIIFYSIYGILKVKNNPATAFWTLLVFKGITLFLATPSAYSLLDLSNKYALTNAIFSMNQLLAAGEALLACNMWNMTGAILGGILMQVGALGISFLMLKDTIFGKPIAIIGIIMYSLYLLHFFIAFFNPFLGGIVLAIAGTLYLVWFPMIGFKLLKIYKISCDSI